LSNGNGFSPFATNLFMSKLEWEVKNQPWFPRFWARYVDDVIAIVKRDKIEETVESLNNSSPTIRFTIEREDERKLPFLDLMLEVNEGEIEFDIYRKPQFVQRFIPNTSHYPVQHKMAAFETMIFRMFNRCLRNNRAETRNSQLPQNHQCRRRKFVFLAPENP
jgi:hypothetical protein